MTIIDPTSPLIDPLPPDRTPTPLPPDHVPTPPPPGPKKPNIEEPPPSHEGAVDADMGDRSGPGAGYDNEPKTIKDKGGVAPS